MNQTTRYLTQFRKWLDDGVMVMVPRYILIGLLLIAFQLTGIIARLTSSVVQVSRKVALV